MKGYTLLEMLVTTAVFTLCLTIVSSSMIYGVNVYNSVKANIDTKGELLTAFDMLREDLKNLIVKPSLITAEISSDSKTISSWTIYAKGGEHAVQYALENGALIRTIDGKKSFILKGECDFEIKMLSRKLAWVSIKYGKDTLASHVRPQASSY